MRGRLSLFLLLFFLAGCGSQPVATTTTPGSGVTPLPTSPVEERPATSPPDLLPSPVPLEHLAPRPGDEHLHKGPVYLDSAQLLVREGQPVPVVLALQGYLPTPCHMLRVAVSAPDERGHIRVEIYSVEEEGKVCVQVLAPFEAQVPLSGYASGHYIVLVNDQEVGEFDR